MKKIILNSLAALVLFTACQQDADNAAADTNFDVNAEESIESAFADIDVVAEAGLEEFVPNGRSVRDQILDCANVERDSVNKILTIDYGDGCEGPEGRVRAGRIIIQYNGRRFEPGSSRIVTFEDFSIDSVGIEGTRTTTNISVDLQDNPTFNVTLVGGRATFPDGTFATREADHTRTWYRATNPREDYSTLDGQASGVDREGTSYSSVITETLTFTRACGRVPIPVSGTKVMTSGETEIIVDFGDGACDNIVEVTQDGETVEREIDVRNHRRKVRGRG